VATLLVGSRPPRTRAGRRTPHPCLRYVPRHAWARWWGSAGWRAPSAAC
jgi:hypothetical protein